MNTSRSRRHAIASLIALAALIGVSAVIASPFALNSLSNAQANWTRLSNIGQTYGAISALLAAVGLSGVAISIVIQIRESRNTRLYATHSRHYDLYRAALDDPALMEVSHSISQIPSLEKRKQAVYINLQLQFWLMLWEIGSLPEATLHGYASDLFGTEPGREYWKNFGASRKSLDTGAHGEGRFLQIVNEEYKRLGEPDHDLPEQVTIVNRKSAIVAGALAGLVTGAALGGSATVVRTVRAAASRDR